MMPGQHGAVTRAERPVAYAPAEGEAALGNPLPPNTGVWYPGGQQPAPTGVGQSPVAGVPAGFSGFYGSDPRSSERPEPYFLPVQAYPVGEPGGMDSSTVGTPTWWRNGIIGFNDQLAVRDRHVYWDPGTQNTGLEHQPGGMPNTSNEPAKWGPRASLRAVNRSVTAQIGSSNDQAQDDLSRPYNRNPQGMYVGEQGSGWSPVYGGTPGVWEPYGTRGGVPYPVQSPVAYGAQGDGPQKVWSGPPHGLHSITLPNNLQTTQKYAATPQMRPVRIDRPANSPQAGQSFSQTVQSQAASGGSGGFRKVGLSSMPGQGRAATGRGWKGTQG